VALLSERSRRLRVTWLLALAVVVAARFDTACADPPTDLEAGRLLTLPGDAAGAALIVNDASAPPTPAPDASSTVGNADDGDTSPNE
jgi:hypothetical protein